MRKFAVALCIVLAIIIPINICFLYFYSQKQNVISDLDELKFMSIQRDTLEYSLEGGSIKATYVNGKLKKMCVMLFGETYRENIEYSFFDSFTYISETKIQYVGSITSYPDTDPNWGVEPPIIKNVEHKKFMISDDKLYDYNMFGEEMILLSDEMKEVIESQIESFLASLEMQITA